MSLSYRKKACDLYKQKYRKIKSNERDSDILFCYYMLSNALTTLKKHDESIKISTEAIKIFEKYKNYIVTKYNGPEQLSHHVVHRAGDYEDTFQYNKAIKDYTRYFELVKTPNTNDRRATDEYIRAARSLSVIYSKKGDSKNTFKYKKLYYESSYKFASDDLDRLASANISMANYYNVIDDSESAIKHTNEAIKLADAGLGKANISYEEKTIHLNNRMTAMLAKSNALELIDPDMDRNKKLALKFIEMNKEFKLLDKRTDGYEFLITYYFDNEDYENLKLTYKKAYKLLDEQLAKAKETRSYKEKFLIGDIRRIKFKEAYDYLDLGKPNEALRLAKELKKYETKDEGRSEIYDKVNLLIVYGRHSSLIDDKKKSITYYLKALDILNKAFEKDFTQETTVLNNLALQYLDIGETDLAVKYMSEVGKRIEKEKGHEIRKVTTYTNLAATIPDRKLAKQYALKAYEVFLNGKDEFRNDITFINTITVLADFYTKEKNFNEAEKIMLSGYEYVKVNYQKNILSFGEYLNLFSDIAGMKKDYDTCIKYSKSYADELEKLDVTSWRLLKPYELLSICHERKKEEEIAFDYSVKSINIILKEFDRHNFELNFEVSRLIQQNRPFIERFISRIILYSNKDKNLLAKYKDINFFNLAFGLQQAIKTNELSVNLSQSISRDLAQDEKQDRKIKQYSSLLVQREGLLKLGSVDVKKVKENNLKLTKVNKQIDLLKKEILQGYPEFKKNFANQVVIASGINPAMKEDEALIQFTIGRHFSFASVISRERNYITTLSNKKKKKLTSHQEVSSMVEKIRASLQLTNAKPQQFDLENSNNLFEILFPKNVLDVIKDKKKLAIVPDGPLYGLPFELLYDKKNRKWLLEQHAITISPSAQSYAALNLDNTIPFSKAKSFVGFGNPKIQDVKVAKNPELKKIELEFSKVMTRGGAVNLKYLKLFPELPETEDELKRISSKFDNNSKLYLREEFNEKLIKSIDFKKFKVVSFASHALVVGEIEGLAEPAIVLSVPREATKEDDGLLTASEIVKLNLNTDLVILSACNTASSSGKTNSEALSGLANSFFYSGAKSLLVTHWSIISDTSVQLVTDTFDFLEETNGDLSLALTKAKIKMLKNYETRHPIYWAPYTLVGRSKI